MHPTASERLLTEATPAGPLLPKPCHLQPAQRYQGGFLRHLLLLDSGYVYWELLRNVRYTTGFLTLSSFLAWACHTCSEKVEAVSSVKQVMKVTDMAWKAEKFWDNDKRAPVCLRLFFSHAFTTSDPVLVEISGIFWWKEVHAMWAGLMIQVSSQNPLNW